MKKKEEIITLTEEQLKACAKSETKITKEYTKVENGYISIVGDIARIYDMQYFRTQNYSSMEKYCADKFGMSRATMYRLIAIQQRFGDMDGNYTLLEEYSNLSLRQMIELIPLPKDKENLLPDNWKELSSPELRKEVKSLLGIEKKPKNDEPEESEAASETPEDGRIRYNMSQPFKQADISKFNSVALEKLVEKLINQIISDGHQFDETTAEFNIIIDVTIPE